MDSAGTGDWHIGSVPHEGTRKPLDSWQISYEGMVARKVVSQDLVKFDYVIGMDDSNVTNLRKLAGGDQAAILKFMDLLPDEKRVRCRIRISLEILMKCTVLLMRGVTSYWTKS